MGKLILVRHGESEANRLRVFAHDDTPLTETGRHQAQEVARKIADRFRPSRVVSSHFVRALQTAEIVAGYFGIELEIMPDLHERDFGRLTGLPYEAYSEMTSRDPGFDPKMPWRWTPEGGETTEAVCRRVVAALRQIRARYPDDEVLVVCHGVVIWSLWAHLTGAWDGEFDIPPNCAVVLLEPVNGSLGTPVLVRECLVANE